MKNGYYIIIALLLFSFPGCKARKLQASYEQVKTETSETTTETETQESEQFDFSEFYKNIAEKIREFNRRIELDSAGNVASVSETYREIVRDDNTKEQNISQNQTVTEKNVAAISISKLDSNVTSKSDLKSDSRPVQGFEWIWVILSVALIVIFIWFLNPKSKIAKRK